ncbi:hypothetical protein [Couchioplanes caeruleus]|uniref:Uncharacterized protein n=1 Tax=Couchioplanes caeruleus subsp. caeruleus TaxID=56427 RepID=A0A1K0FFS3_9ACTN|nr:hypothetical protein [Couchioplanes caeruleus]OJF11695.1 hypothetical protein BG844_24785 [Couchioplanes caeruleus subsp. caeruleus]
MKVLAPRLRDSAVAIVRAGVVTGRVFPPRRRRRLVWWLLTAATVLIVAAVLSGWNPAGWRPPKLGWTGTEQAGWFAGIGAAVFGLASTAASCG